MWTGSTCLSVFLEPKEPLTHLRLTENDGTLPRKPSMTPSSRETLHPSRGSQAICPPLDPIIRGDDAERRGPVVRLAFESRVADGDGSLPSRSAPVDRLPPSNRAKSISRTLDAGMQFRVESASHRTRAASTRKSR